MAKIDSMTNRQRQAMEMRQKIYLKSIELFRHNPYENIAVSDICKAADISIGNFYHYFKNKDDILNESFRDLNKRFREQFSASDLPPLEKVFLAFGLMARGIEEKGYYFASAFLHNEIFYLVPYQDNPERSIHSFVFRALQDAFDSGVLINGDPTQLYYDIYRIHKGVTFDWVIRRAAFPLKEETIRMIEQTIAPYRPQQD